MNTNHGMDEERTAGDDARVLVEFDHMDLAHMSCQPSSSHSGSDIPHKHRAVPTGRGKLCIVMGAVSHSSETKYIT